MKTKNCALWNRLTAQLIVVFVILFVFFDSGCSTISPKLQDQYIRPGLSQGMHGAFDEYRRRIHEIMGEDKLPDLSLALVDRDGILAKRAALN